MRITLRKNKKALIKCLVESAEILKNYGCARSIAMRRNCTIRRSSHPFVHLILRIKDTIIVHQTQRFVIGKGLAQVIHDDCGKFQRDKILTEFHVFDDHGTTTILQIDKMSTGAFQGHLGFGGRGTNDRIKWLFNLELQKKKKCKLEARWKRMEGGGRMDHLIQTSKGYT